MIIYQKSFQILTIHRANRGLPLQSTSSYLSSAIKQQWD